MTEALTGGAVIGTGRGGDTAGMMHHATVRKRGVVAGGSAAGTMKAALLLRGGATTEAMGSVVWAGRDRGQGGRARDGGQGMTLPAPRHVTVLQQGLGMTHHDL